ncbi:MAG: hypothetical protein EP335_14125 [Alphaproteobacteria bacterium]|nr:MAG: hypothetical protein EP335_14125 [Alphaproteobacteria bacterium]
MISGKGQFRPGVPLTVTVIVCIAILIGLGTWQARKVGPKTELLARIEAGLKAEPMPLPVHLDDPTTVEFRRVSFSGTVMDAEPVKVFGTNLKGGAGYQLYLPVQKRYGMNVLVNFGWVPANTTALPSLMQGQEIMVTGVLRTSAVPGSMTPANEPDKDAWFTADVHQMAAHFGLKSKEYYHFRVMADQGVLEGALPEGGQVRVDIPNDHFQYALTWYGLALSLIGVYIAFGLKRGAKGA